MNTEDLIKMIDLYFDEELEKNKEPLLFSLLSANEEGREYFKNMQTLKTFAGETKQEFPDKLDERIFYSIQNKSINSTKSFKSRIITPIISYATFVIVIVTMIVMFNKINEYKKEVDYTMRIVKSNNETLELLFNNSLPTAVVTTTLDNEILIKSN